MTPEKRARRKIIKNLSAAREALQQLVSAVRPTIGATQEQKDEMLGRYFDALDNAEKLLRAFKGFEK
jgi:hypothetical protein